VVSLCGSQISTSFYTVRQAGEAHGTSRRAGTWLSQWSCRCSGCCRRSRWTGGEAAVDEQVVHAIRAGWGACVDLFGG